MFENVANDINKNYVVYGLTTDMQDCIKSSMEALKTTPLQDVLDSVEKSSLIKREKNIVMFEIGRMFERGKYARR
jgi:hypothetical protein